MPDVQVSLAYEAKVFEIYLAIKLFGQKSHLLDDQPRSKLRQFDDE